MSNSWNLRVLLRLEHSYDGLDFDSWSFSYYLHQNGINCRYLGVMLATTRTAWLRHLLTIEIVARTVKNILRICLIKYFLGRSRVTVDIGDTLKGESGVTIINRTGLSKRKNSKENLQMLLGVPLWVAARLLDESPYVNENDLLQGKEFSG